MVNYPSHGGKIEKFYVAFRFWGAQMSNLASSASLMKKEIPTTSLDDLSAYEKLRSPLVPFQWWNNGVVWLWRVGQQQQQCPLFYPSSYKLVYVDFIIYAGRSLVLFRSFFLTKIVGSSFGMVLTPMLATSSYTELHVSAWLNIVGTMPGGGGILPCTVRA